MTEYLNLDDLLEVGQVAVAQELAVQDYGLLESALVRPAATVFTRDAYPDLHVKAAALLHSLCTNHASVDGNKRLAWAACRVFLLINGQSIVGSEQDRFDLVMSVASGGVTDLEEIAGELRC